MYFPYLRARQYELLALRESFDLFNRNGGIVPVIEPVMDDVSALNRAVMGFNEANLPFVLVTNPQVGEIDDDKIDSSVISENFEGGSSGLLAYIVTGETYESQIHIFLEKYKEQRVCLMHQSNYSDDMGSLQSLLTDYGNTEYHIFLDNTTSTGYRNSFSKVPKVLIRDGFQKRARNADYPNDDFFTELHLNYVSSGYEGFGDFLTVGNHYQPGGGMPHAVTIHLTRVEPSTNEVWMKHFVSNDTTTQQDTARKFAQALQKLTDFIGQNPVMETEATNKFLELHDDGHFPNLGFVKKLSLKHHLELMSRFP